MCDETEFTDDFGELLVGPVDLENIPSAASLGNIDDLSQIEIQLGGRTVMRADLPSDLPVQALFAAYQTDEDGVFTIIRDENNMPREFGPGESLSGIPRIEKIEKVVLFASLQNITAEDLRQNLQDNLKIEVCGKLNS